MYITALSLSLSPYLFLIPLSLPTISLCLLILPLILPGSLSVSLYSLPPFRPPSLPLSLFLSSPQFSEWLLKVQPTLSQVLHLLPERVEGVVQLSSQLSLSACSAIKSLQSCMCCALPRSVMISPTYRLEKCFDFDNHNNIILLWLSK